MPQAAADRSPTRDAGESRRAIGYLLLEPGDDQIAWRTQELRRWCAAHAVDLAHVVHDTEVVGEQRARPSLQWALARIAARDVDTLVVTRLADLSPSVSALSPLLRWFMDPGRDLVAIDVKIDTTTPEGQLAIDAVAGVGSSERERMSARTRRGLEAARASGRASVSDVPALSERIAQMRSEGMTLQAIADVLNEDGVATVRGGAKWRPSSVQRAAGYRRPAALPHGIGLPEQRRRSA